MTVGLLLRMSRRPTGWPGASNVDGRTPAEPGDRRPPPSAILTANGVGVGALDTQLAEPIAHDHAAPARVEHRTQRQQLAQCSTAQARASSTVIESMRRRSYAFAMLGDYYRYPCTIDAACPDMLRIDTTTFREIANHAVDDQAVLDQLARVGADLQRLVSFDPAQLNVELHRDGS